MSYTDLRTWAEVHLDRLYDNYQALKKTVPEGSELMGVVKANAYGHDDMMVSLALQKWGVRVFAVSSIGEAARLRQCGIEGEILILGFTPPSDVEHMLQYRVTQTVISKEYGIELANALNGRRLNVQIAIDTGMRRLGLNADDPALCAADIAVLQSMLQVTGMFTHLCVADTQTPEAIAFTKQQIARMHAVAEALKTPLPFHYCNSAGGLYYQSAKSRYTRCGITLYGLTPDRSLHLPISLKPVLDWKTVVAMVKSIEPGDTVGYGRRYTAESQRMLATLPVGYADGYFRSLSGVGSVLIHGQYAPICGRICMDQMMVDVTEIPDVQPGDTVTLLGTDGEASITADDLAALCDTIGYEIVCAISKRIPRVIMEHGQILRVMDYNAPVLLEQDSF